MTSFKKSPLVECAYNGLIKPKFPAGTIVKVQDDMPASMSHFASGFIGVIASEYCGEYKLIALNKDGIPVNATAWYKEDMLTLISDDVEYGKKVIAVYKSNKSINYGK